MIKNPRISFGGKDLQHKLAVLCAVVSMAVVVFSYSASAAIGFTNLGGFAPAITGLVMYATARYVLNRSEKWR